MWTKFSPLCGLFLSTCLALPAGADSADEPAEEKTRLPARAVKSLRAVAADQAAVVRFQALAGQQIDRWIVDPQNSVERFLLLTPAGPLVVEISLTIDGEPFRAPRERLVDQTLKQGDTDGDGTPTWKEAFANRRFGYGRFANFGALNEQQREQQIKAFDRNQNGRLDRAEARMFLSQSFGGATFSLQGYRFNAGSTETRQLLDVDQDGRISSAELDASAERLKSRDGDDNDVLYSSELSGQTNPYGNLQVRANGRVTEQESIAHILGPMLNAPLVHQQLLRRLGGNDQELGAEDFPLTPTLLPTLDLDGNGELDVAEVFGFNSIAPHIRLAGNFGETTAPRGLTLLGIDADLGTVEQIVSREGEQFVLRLQGLVLRLAAGPEAAPYNSQSFQNQRDVLMRQLDTNKNGYIEKEELTGNVQAYAAQFDGWDIDGDGKVFPEELTSFFEQQFAPLRTQISAATSKEADPLFHLLDGNGDGRLGLREMNSAAQRLRTFDQDGNGEIAANEVPSQMTLTFTRGQAQYGQRGLVRSASGGVVIAGQQPAARLGWFQRMDRNGDGDLSPREFLGTAEQFSTLDADRDGLIAQSEAELNK